MDDKNASDDECLTEVSTESDEWPSLNKLATSVFKCVGVTRDP